MANKFLDYTGLTYLYSKIMARMNLKVDKVDGKGLSTNDYTSAEKSKLAAVPAFFVQTSTPSSAATGSIWFDTTSGAECIKCYTGSTWIPFGAVYK